MYIGIGLGGTNIAAGIVDNNGKIIRKASVPTQKERHYGEIIIAEGVSNMINIFQPDMFVIGGGISKEGDELLTPIKQFVYENDYNKYMPKTEIKIAELYNDAGIIGAAMAAVNKE